MVRNFIGLLVGLLAGAPAAFAAHPLTTDDVGTQGAGKIEVEASAQADSGLLLGVGLSVHAGLADQLDLGATALYQGARQGGEWSAGMGDPLIDLKWRLLDPAEAPGLALRLDFVPRPLAGHDGSLVLISSWARGRLELHANAGATFSGLGSAYVQPTVQCAAGGGWLATSALRLLAEGVLQVDAAGALSGGVLAAAQWQASETLSLSAGAGPSLGPDTRPVWLMAFGVTVVGG